MQTRRTFRGPGPFRPAALLSTLLLLGLSACAGSNTQAKNPFGGAAEMQQIRITVTNLNWNDATLHALRGGERVRLGVVSGKSDARYTIDWPMNLDLQVEIDLLAGGTCRTRRMAVSPGDVVDLQIDANLDRSPYCTRI